MRVLICINNNLKYDTRVKRHASAIARRGHLVHVAACPVPDETFALNEPGVTHSMTSYTPGEHPINGKILNFARKYGLEKIFLESFPILASQAYYYEPEIERYTALLNRYVSGGRWKDITSRCSEEMTLTQAMSYPLCFFERSVQYAADVLEYPADVVLCNDVDTLLAGVVHKMTYHSRLIYDFHDLAADLSENVFPQMYSNVLALFEKKMILYADIVMSVSKSAIMWSRQHYGFLAPAVYMPNCSAYAMDKVSACVKERRDESIRIYYHGMCDPSRGLAELLAAVKVSKRFRLVLRCLPSEYLEELKEMASSMGMEEQVTFLDPVPSEQILYAARRDGDIGFAFCQTGQCLNWRFALQNKFIEYTKAGLAVITSDTAEQGSIIRDYQFGWVLEENSVQGIERVFDRIWKERNSLPELSEKAWECADKLFHWDTYEAALNDLIENGPKARGHYMECAVDEKLLESWEQEDIQLSEMSELKS